MARTVFSVLRDQIESEKQRAMAHLGTGACKDFAEYRELSGVIRGLTAAQNLVQDLATNMEDNND